MSWVTVLHCETCDRTFDSLTEDRWAVQIQAERFGWVCDDETEDRCPGCARAES